MKVEYCDIWLVNECPLHAQARWWSGMLWLQHFCCTLYSDTTVVRKLLHFLSMNNNFWRRLNIQYSHAIKEALVNRGFPHLIQIVWEKSLCMIVGLSFTACSYDFRSCKLTFLSFTFAQLKCLAFMENVSSKVSLKHIC